MTKVGESEALSSNVAYLCTKLTPKGSQQLAGGKRSATTGPEPLEPQYPGGMAALVNEKPRELQTTNSTARPRLLASLRDAPTKYQ